MKEMKKMKKMIAGRLLLPAGLLMLAAWGASAQNADHYSDRYLSNNLSSDWFVGISGGGNVYFGDHNRQMEIKDRPSYGGGIYFGKWWTGVIGTRVGYSFYNLKGTTQNGSHSTGKVYDAGQKLEFQTFDAGHVFGDVMFDLTNLLLGIKPQRFYSLSPYVGIGWMRTWDQPQTEAVSANLGILNLFRLSNKLDLTLDIRGAMVDDHFDGERGGRQEEGLLSAELGFSYHFGKSSPRPACAISAEELALLNDKLNQINRENAGLIDRLATVVPPSAPTKGIEKIIYDCKDAAADVLILFPIRQTSLTKEARVQLGFLAKVMTDKPEMHYSITGYADAATGNDGINDRLSKERAESVRACLIAEYGISPSRLKIVAAGGVATQYYNDPALSRSVIIRSTKPQ